MGFVTIEESDDEKSIVTPDCRLFFLRERERWTHAIEAGPSGNRVRIAESIEADESLDDYRRIVSPIYQDLHIHEADQKKIFLLVGQFGPRHFSAAITVRYTEPWNPLDRTPGPQSTEIEFDVAQRCRERVEHLSSGYSVVGSRNGKGGWEARTETDFAVATVNRSDCPTAEEKVSEATPGRLRVQFIRELLDFQANARLVYTWSIHSLR